MVASLPLNAFGDARQISVERALAEFRAARPVAIHSDGTVALAFPLESLTSELLALFHREERRARLIVPAAKISSSVKWKEQAAAIDLTPATLKIVEEYLHHGLHKQSLSGVKIQTPQAADEAALLLANLALLLPAVVVICIGPDDIGGSLIVSIHAQDIFSFRDRRASSLKIVSRAVIPLDGVASSEFVAFRGGDGFRDQIAVLVSNPSPSRPVLTRIHSACLTGDLFGSLKCDCGEQLRGSVRAMGEQGGGVLIYLDQEGRGNGIANKLRAYCLQDQGLDTYDADELLGFGQDQRRFDFAAEMLKQLGYRSIRLMTNNPCKIASLREAGLEVVSTHRVLTRPTAHNAKYLAAKREKAGHLLGEPDADLIGVAK